MAQELEASIGGLYSILTQELQLPLVHRLIYILQRQQKLPNFPVSQATGDPLVNPKPVISDTNQPDIIKDELEKITPSGKSRIDIIGQNGNTGEHYEEVEKPKVRMVVEVTIPTESELKGMTKSKIRQEALGLGFEGVTTKDPKATMIENFVQATEKFISDLKDSGEFVSADEEESDDGETENDRDGGYFK